MMPASRAVSSGSPFFSRPARTCRIASADMLMRPRATASRAVGTFSLTSTMRIRPAGSMCDRAEPPRPGRVDCDFLLTGVSLGKEERQAFERHGQIQAFQLHPTRHLECAWREVEDRLHACPDHDVDDLLGRRGGDRYHRDLNPFALHDFFELTNIVDDHAAA